MKHVPRIFWVCIGLYFICFLPLFGDNCRPERLAFPSLCKSHFFDQKNVAMNTWLETCDRASINEIKKFLYLIPKPYIADCFQCGCGGVSINRYNDIDLPLGDVEAMNEIRNIHRYVKHGSVEVCRNNSGPGHCEDLCWDGGYFRRLNHKYFPFFKHYLVYCHQNPICECYWHELSEQAVEINNEVYIVLRTLAEKQLVNPEFSDLWICKQIVFQRSGKTFGDSYFPNSHGMASSLATYTFFYSQYRQVLLDVAKYIDYNAVLGLESSIALDSIYNAMEKLKIDFLRLYKTCLEEHPHPKIVYERGMLWMHTGKPEAALKDIQYLIKFSKYESYKDQQILNSEIYHQEGQAYADLGMYDQAIKSLTKAIELDPKNQNVFYRRAEAYFEKGNFDKALDDFLVSGMKRNKPGKSSKISIEFQKAFFYHLVEGAHEASLEFIPMMAQSMYGISQILWAKVSHPVECYDDFMVSAYRVGQYLAKRYKNFDWNKFEAECLSEFKEFCERFADLSEAEKGKILGHMIGKYGIDVLAGGVAIHEIEMFARLKEANRLCNLQAATISQANKEALAAKALTHHLERQKYFKSVKVHWDSQNKHIPGKYNYDIRKSIFEHDDAQMLINKHGGTGIVIRGTPGDAGYQEIVNFGEFIGYSLSERNGTKTATNWGKIHYSNKGAHIVPTYPKD